MDKVQLIEEIERRLNQAKDFSERANGANDETSKLAWNFVATQYESLIQFIDSLPEEHNEDLEREIGLYTTHSLLKKRNHDTGVYHLTQKDCDNIARHFAEWQKQQMKETLQTEYEKGRFDMREEMMKDAVLETKVMMDCDGDGVETPYEEWLTLENTEIPYIPNNLGLKEGDKVKIIIVKTE